MSIAGVASVVGGAIATSLGAGAVVSSIAGAVAGGAVGIAGAALGGGKKAGASGGGGGTPPDPLASLAAVKNLKGDNKPATMGDTKVATTASLSQVPGAMEDPWKPAKDMYTDLGGDPNNLPTISSYLDEAI